MYNLICIAEDFWTWSSLLCGNHLGDLSAWLYPF
jgi:hypothetical protein